jgi:hypothetical protein
MKKKWWIVAAVVVVLSIACMILCKKYCTKMGCCGKDEDSFTPV